MNRLVQVIITVLMMIVLSACGPSDSRIPYEDVPQSGDATNGEALFTEYSCIACHYEGATGAPYLAGLAERADSTIEGQDAREYIFYSVVQPADYIVEGYGNAMPANYDDRMTSQEMADLLAYLLDL